MAHSCCPDKLLELSGDKLGAIVGYNPWLDIRKAFPCSLDDNFNLCLGHALTDLPMNNISTAPIQDGAEVVKRPTDIDMRDVNMPVFVRLERLLESISLFAGCTVPAFEQAGSRQYPVHRTGADGNDVLVEHHKGKATIPLKGISLMKSDDRRLLPFFKPEISRNQSVMLVDLAVAGLPVVILAAGNPQPQQKPLQRQACLG